MEALMKKLILLLPALFVLAGCGVKQKSLLTKLSQGMSKDTVKMRIGKPDDIKCPTTNYKGDVIDIWEYSLATVDQNKKTKQTFVSILAGLFFWPIYLFIPFMDSPYDYDMYYLEFINSYLSRWGKSSELNMPPKTFKS